jgi:hypothetical protein
MAPARQGGFNCFRAQVSDQSRFAGTVSLRAPPLTPTIRPPTMAAAPKGIPTIPPLSRERARNHTPALTKGGDNADVNSTMT